MFLKRGVPKPPKKILRHGVWEISLDVLCPLAECADTGTLVHMATKPITIHVDFNPDHDPMTFGDTNGEPILFYRRPTHRELANLERIRSGRATGGPFPEGWVLIYEGTFCDGYEPHERGGGNPGEWITGISDLTAVDEAVASAQEHLRRMGYREPPG
jgi:hypothetical protein